MTTTTSTTVRRTAAVLILALLVSLLGTTGPWKAEARAVTFTRAPVTTFDSRLLAWINHARTSRGLGRLPLVAGTTDVAHGWTCHLAADRLLAHNGSLGYAL